MSKIKCKSEKTQKQEKKTQNSYKCYKFGIKYY